MKLIACRNFFNIQRKVVAKTLLIMKITAILVFAFCISVHAKSYSQKFNLSLKNDRLEKVFKDISNQSEYTFVFTESLIKKSKKVTTSLYNASIEDVLEKVLNEQSLTYAIVNSIIIIKEIEAPVKSEILLPPPPVKIKGTVVDELGNPLQGVTILIKGTKLGTSSDANGVFEIEFVEKSTKVLVFSFVGMENREVNVEGKDNVKISLKVQSTASSEIVMVGYGSQKRATVTGSISTVKGDVLSKNPSSNFAGSLAGRLPGLTVNIRNGDPGNEATEISLRGQSTLGSNAVLLVIDGVIGGDLRTLNPADIESISILKDASAAIYGARSANGVILVTTKRGKSGKPTINYSGNFGNAQPTRLQNLMESSQYAIAENEYLVNTGLTKKWTDNDIKLFADGSDPIQHPNEDWYNVALRKWVPQQQHNLSVSGGNDAVRYFVSGQILDQDRIFKENDNLGLSRYQLRANIDATITKSLSIGVDMKYDKNMIENAYDGNYRPFYQIRSMFPNWQAYFPNGLPGPVAFGQNPALMGSSSKYGYNREDGFGFYTRLFFKMNLSKITPGLFMEGFASNTDGAQNFEKLFRKSYFYTYDAANNKYIANAAGQTTQNPELRETNNRGNWQTLNFKIGYQKTFGKHNVDGFAAVEQFKSTWSGFSAYRKDFLTDQLPVLSAGNDVGKDNSGYKTDAARLNYFGRFNYSYLDRYLLSVTMRYDGSQNFPAANRFGWFPGVSAGWIVSKEAFMQNVNWVSFLKLRASWGKMGNDAVPNFQYLATYGNGGGYYFGAPGTTREPGFIQTTTPNPNITWELAETQNIGIDGTLLNGLLTFSFDYFNSTRSNILTKKNASTPDYTGLILPDVNIGTVFNKGYELALTHNRAINKSLSYSVGGNISYARNKITFFDESPNVPDYQRKTGLPIGSTLLYKADGIYQTQADIDKTPHLSNTAPGDIKYVDVNKDGKIDASDQIMMDQTKLPEIMYGLNLGAKYKNFELVIFLQGQSNTMVRLIPEGLNMDKTFFNGRWQKAGDDLYPRSFNSNRGAVGNNALNSTFWMKDGSFLRLKNVEFAWTLPKKWMDALSVSNARLYVNGANLLLLSDHIKIVDPETLQNTGENLAAYPIQRIVNIGVNLNF